MTTAVQPQQIDASSAILVSNALLAFFTTHQYDARMMAMPLFSDHTVLTRFATHFLAVGAVTFYSDAAHLHFSFSNRFRAKIRDFQTRKK